MGELLALSAQILAGDAAIEDHHPFAPVNRLEEVGDGVAFVQSFANVTALSTDEGLCVVDTGSQFTGGLVRDAVREWSAAPGHTVVYTHGHIDHVMGTPAWETDDHRVRVVGHEGVAPRFDRYVRTAGYNAVINRRQFRAPALEWPVDYRRPDVTFRDELAIEVGDLSIELHHARGETDDHTWAWVPDRRVLCTGDLIIWCTPNAGNPQKVQRYAGEWAAALRAMAALGAELLLPGHGLPIAGEETVRTVLIDTATLLETIEEQVVAMMNEGARLDDILHGVEVPAGLLEKPYLRPIYDEPEFIVRNVWRLYGGWYDGNPANLKPARERVLAAELAALAGGADVLARRALTLADEGDLRIAGHLAEMAALAAPDDPEVNRARADVFGRRARDATSLMARGVFSWAESESQSRSGT